MATNKKKEVKQEDSGTTEKAGVTYVNSFCEPYSIKDIDAKKMYELQENLLIAGSLYQMTNLVVSGDVKISVYNETDDVVEDVSRDLNRMFSTKECNLSSVCRSTLNDLFIWGISIYNWVWENEGGRIVCKQLNRINPYNFATCNVGSPNTQIYGRLLKGIYYDMLDEKVHYVIVNHMTGLHEEIDSKNLLVIRDPTSNYPDGNSVFLPAAQVADFSNYAWNTLGQQMFRTGAPIMFIKITNPAPSRTIGGTYIEGDVEYANKILANWGKDTPYVLRENMEVINVSVSETALSIRALDKAGEMIRQYISPVGMLGKDGTLISGNTDAALRLVNNNIRGWVSMLESQLVEVANYYLRSNFYPEDWYAKIEIPTTQIEDTAQKLQTVTTLAGLGVISPNEVREDTGYEGVSDEEYVEMKGQWGLVNGGSLPENPYPEADQLGEELEDSIIEGVPDQIPSNVVFSEMKKARTNSTKRQKEIANRMKTEMDETTDDLLSKMTKVLRKASNNE